MNDVSEGLRDYTSVWNFTVLPAILVPRHNLAGDESVLYNTSIEELSVSVPENTSFHATLNHQHHNQQSIPQSPQQQQQQQQQQPPNNPYQGIQVGGRRKLHLLFRRVTSTENFLRVLLEYAGDESS